MSRPTLEVADIIRASGSSFWELHGSHLALQHRKVLDAIVRCRTPALGGHRDLCLRCGHQAISYKLVPQPALPQVSGQRTRQVAGRALGRAIARALLPRRLHTAPRAISACASEQATTLRSPLPQQRRLVGRRRSQPLVICSMRNIGSEHNGQRGWQTSCPLSYRIGLEASWHRQFLTPTCTPWL